VTSIFKKVVNDTEFQSLARYDFMTFDSSLKQPWIVRVRSSTSELSGSQPCITAERADDAFQALLQSGRMS
jgi:hypothetical protein